MSDALTESLRSKLCDGEVLEPWPLPVSVEDYRLATEWTLVVQGFRYLLQLRGVRSDAEPLVALSEDMGMRLVCWAGNVDAVLSEVRVHAAQLALAEPVKKAAAAVLTAAGMVPSDGEWGGFFLTAMVEGSKFTGGVIVSHGSEDPWRFRLASDSTRVRYGAALAAAGWRDWPVPQRLTRVWTPPGSVPTWG